ncbi:OTU domain-containing protein 4 [Scomber japonicus]|uniref:OTU domain-containing protein 4 n=1 Tax=Scomber japonicus TaxID=13676 RepID=UPI0023057C9F|nr:OTU domain-containing protein 4 [Scomber japonicus]
MDRSTEERGTEEKLMDQYLKSKGLHRSKVAKDGSCLFRAVAEQVLHCQSRHTEVRAKCVEFLKENRESYEAFIEGDFEDYLLKLQDPQQWVGEVEINALAVMYKRDFLIFQEPGKPAVNITDKNFKETVQLCFLNGNHYDSVYPISRVKSAAVCQSVLYELLYEDVFNVDRSLLGMCQRSSRANDLLSDDNMPACPSSDESDLDGNEPIWVENGTSTTAPRHRGRGRGRMLPERVRRSLNPTLFRNVEYDIWHKTKRAQQRMDYSVAVGMQYSIGDRCQVRLEGSGRIYNATIKEPHRNNRDLVTVYIDDLGKIRQVPLWNLRAPSEESSWSTVSRDKRLSNGHGDWEERSRGGRGRGKLVSSSSSSVAPATAPGPGGRMIKQHSWPPQAPTDEQGGPRPNRYKSVSSADSGLTEKQRTAKDEEEDVELNAALLAIELTDEHSFPALGAQSGVPGEAGRKKGVDKKRSLRNKTKSPVEDVRAMSPSAGERPKSSTPPPATAAAPAAPPAANTPTPNNPTPPPSLPPAVKLPPAAPPSSSDSSSAWLSSLKAPTANMNVTSSTTAAQKTSTLSYASAAAAPLSSKPPSVPSSATLFSQLPSAFPAASSPPIPPALSSPSPPPPPTSSSPSSSLPPPTFIAPIAPSPFAAQGFLSRSSPPVSSFLSHSPSPPLFPSSVQSTSSSSFTHAPPLQVHEAPAAAVKTSNSLPNIGSPLAAPQTLQNLPSLSQIHPQVPLPQNQSQFAVSHIQTQSQASLPQNHISLPQVQSEVQSAPPHVQHQPQSHTEVASVPLNQIQMQASVSQSQAQYPPQSQSSYPHHAQPSVPVSASMQPQQHLPAQPPQPSQVPHPSLSLSPTHPPLQTQTPDAQNQSVAPPPSAQPESQPPPPSPPSHHPQLQSAPPLPLPLMHPTSVPGGIPVQQLSQLYQDPLYPGFPQGEKGNVAMNPQFSKSKSGADLPQDINVLRFFFNLGLKAYTMPMFQPYVYLFPLQHAYTMQPKLPSRSPSPTPHYPPPNPSPGHQEVFPPHPPPYPPTSGSVTPQYDPHVASQAQTPEPPHPSEPAQNLSGYPVTQPPASRIPWAQHQLPPPRNPSFPGSYPAPSPPYPTMPTSTQGYHPSQGSRPPMFPQSMPHYPSSSLGYPSSATPEEHQMRHRPMEQIHPGNGGPMPGHGPSRALGPLEASGAADKATANSSRVMVAPGASGFGLKKEQGENLTPVLLVDPPINNRPIVTWVSDPEVRESSMQTSSSTSGSPGRYDVTSRRSVVLSDNNTARVFRGHQHKPANHSKPYPSPEPGFLVTVTMPEPLSIGCSTEDAWEGSEGRRENQRQCRPARPNARARFGETRTLSEFSPSFAIRYCLIA